MIHEIRKLLGLQAKRRMPSIAFPILAIQRAIQKVARIKLHARLVGPDFQHTSALGILHAPGKGELFTSAFEHKVMIISGRLAVELIEPRTNGGGRQ